jgi:hypothetical protein
MTDLTPSDATMSAITPNTIYTSPTHVYDLSNDGLIYAIQGTGGFTAVQGFDTVHRLTETLIAQYDVTGSVEVLLDVRTFNEKLNIYKDSSNIDVSSVPVFYDSVNDLLLTDSVTLTSTEFVAGLNNNTSRVISVGKYSTLYSDFAAYVAAYFGLPSSNTTETAQGVATLFSAEYNLNPNSGVFDASAFLSLMAGATADGSGAYINDLSGSITIANITKLLRNAVDANPFGNRDPSSGTTASDSSNRSNYGVSDGFFANDLFFIPSAGITVTLNVIIDSEGFPMPLNNIGPTMSAVTGATADAAFAAGTTTTSTFTESSTATTLLITRTLTAPLLIRLADLS